MERKFRIWDKEYKKMQYTFSVALNPMYNFCTPFAEFADNLVVMQYANLKDRNSVEIYEGDIIRHRYRYEDKTSDMIISYNKGAFLCTFGNRFTYVRDLCGYYDDNIKTGHIDCEILGNIYEGETYENNK